MEFSFTPEQPALRQQVLRFARQEIAPRVRGHDPRSELDLRWWRRPGEEGAGFMMARQTVESDRSTLLAPFLGQIAPCGTTVEVARMAIADAMPARG